MRLTHIFLALIPLFAATQSANAYWQSLGRLNALKAGPNVTNCQQRFINHYDTRKIIIYPDAIVLDPKYGARFKFQLDLESLENFTKNDATKSSFDNALETYRGATRSKSISLLILTGLGQKPINNLVFIEIDSPDNLSGINSINWNVDQSELGYYELQQNCL